MGGVEDTESVGLELEIPGGERRAQLLAALARLIRLRGFETFVTTPLLLPAPEFFPERWERSVRGAGRLLARLMRYAGLGKRRLRLHGFRRQPDQVGEGAWVRRYGEDTAAWFAGFHDDACHFGLELRGLSSETRLVATLGHEVAHAYREEHSLVVRDRGTEEKLTDLTAVYLGFGVFLLEASHFVETGGYSEMGDRLLYQRGSLGYLSPAEFALVLSAQVVARDLHASARRAIHEALSPNHARLFELGCEEFSRDIVGLRVELGIPEPSNWPKAPDLTAFTGLPVTDEEIECSETDGEDQAPAVVDMPGHVAFRVRSQKHVVLTVLGCGLAFMLCIAIQASGGVWLVFLALGGLGGYVLGAAKTKTECSDCGASLVDDSARCGSCGARFVGKIDHRDERLDALEKYHASLPSKQETENTDESDDRDDQVVELLTAMFVAWAMTRGLGAGGRSQAVLELEQRVAKGDFDATALYRAWLVEPEMLDDEATAFAFYYMQEAPQRLRNRDFEIITTANSLADDPTSYRRFATVLDRRFQEWRAAAGGLPHHAL
jgi:hypothetical protein